MKLRFIYHKIYSVLIIFLLISTISYAQDYDRSTDIPKVVPISPNAASLGVYGAIPVSHYTGIANISIPLYEINLDGKFFPISLSYHSSGIKVAQEASNVGLGWSLVAGGAIIKEVRGWDDFITHPLGYYFDTNMPPARSDNNPVLTPELYQKYEGYYKNQYDPEPDIFHFNFGGFSGSMFFQKLNLGKNNRNTAYPIICKQREYLHIEYDINKNIWKIYDGDGYKYCFNSYETTKYYNDGGYGVNQHPLSMNRDRILNQTRSYQAEVITSFYLDSIVSPKGNKISFEYKKDEIYSTIGMSESVYRLIDQFGSIYGDFEGKVESYSYSIAKIDQLYISKITTDKEIIDFETSDRYDIESADPSKKAQIIQSMSVKDIQDQLIKTVEFDYSELGNSSNYKDNRLCLNKIEEFTGKIVKPYRFTYNNSVELPDKYSNQTDDWGYYNGQQASSNRWDETPLNVGLNLQTKIPEFQLSSDRLFKGRKSLVSDTHIQAGILESITYPTGLRTEFIYEPHIVEGGNMNTVETRFEELAKVAAKNYEADDEPEYNGDILIQEFTLEQDVLEAEVSVFLGIYEKYDGEDDSIWRDCIVLWKDGQIINRFFVSYDDYNKIKTHTLKSLRKGKYAFQLMKESIYSPHKYSIGARFGYKEVVNVNHKFKGKAGGLRIKEIRNIDRDNIVSRQTYSYSTGKLMSQPKFVGKTLAAFVPAKETYASVAVYLHGKSTPWQPFSSSAMGNPVGYDWVRQSFHPNNNNNGSILYEFHNEPDRFPQDLEYLEGYQIKGLRGDADFQNGLLQFETTFNKNEEITQYNSFDYAQNTEMSQSTKGLVIDVSDVAPAEDNGIDNGARIRFYDVRSEFWYLSEKKTYEYTPEGEYITRLTENKFSYDFKNLKPTQIEQVINNNKKLVYKNYYPTGLSDAISKKMLLKHMVNPVIENIKLIDGKIIGGSILTYTDTINMLLPVKMYCLELNPSINLTNYRNYKKLEYAINRYDPKGNILQYTTLDGISTSYLWSYNYKYPIAEIKNAKYDNILNELPVTPEALSSSNTPDMTVVNNLRDKLPNAHITTYTYKPLYGIETITDPRGVTTTYEYNDYARIKWIKDHTGNLIEEYKYKYREEQTHKTLLIK